MPPSRTLRGGCQCGRNIYIVQPPPDAIEQALLLFDPAPAHRLSLASPLPTYLRVPLSWYHSQTQPYFADETPALIHRTYEHHTPRHLLNKHKRSPSPATRRNFCGFCGTPLSFWSEDPQPEAEYIRLALGSLNIEDLEELDEWAEMQKGGDEEKEEKEEKEEQEEEVRNGGLTGIPWFDSIVEGSQLGRYLALEKKQRQQQQQQLEQKGTGTGHVHRHEAGSARSADGRMQVEWEVLEWTEGDDEGGATTTAAAGSITGADGVVRPQPSPAKRARIGGEDDSDRSRGQSETMD